MPTQAYDQLSADAALATARGLEKLKVVAPSSVEAKTGVCCIDGVPKPNLSPKQCKVQGGTWKSSGEC